MYDDFLNPYFNILLTLSQTNFNYLITKRAACSKQVNYLQWTFLFGPNENINEEKVKKSSKIISIWKSELVMPHFKFIGLLRVGWRDVYWIFYNRPYHVVPDPLESIKLICPIDVQVNLILFFSSEARFSSCDFTQTPCT